MAQSPACKASRMRLDDMTPASSLTGPIAVQVSPSAAPTLRNTPTFPPRPFPKVKSSPVTTAETPRRSTSSLMMKSSAVVAARLASKLNTSIASAPAPANKRWR